MDKYVDWRRSKHVLTYLDKKSLAPCFGLLLLLAHYNTHTQLFLPFLLLQYDAPHIHWLAPLSSSSSLLLLVLLFASGHWLLLCCYCLAAVLYAR